LRSERRMSCRSHNRETGALSSIYRVASRSLVKLLPECRTALNAENPALRPPGADFRPTPDGGARSWQ
jgi:hypothetical protein